MRLVAAARVLVGAATQEAQRRLSERGIHVTPVESVLLGLLLRGGGVRPTELAARTSATKQALQVPLRRLEQRGLIERTADPGDGRAHLLRLTDRGREAAVAAIEVAEEIDHGWLDAISEQQFEATKEVLLRLARSLAADQP